MEYAGYDKSRQVGQISLYEKEQYRQTGLSKEDHMQQVTEAWQHSDDARSFVQALGERGYILATGKRPYVLVDLYGGNHALPKLIADKAVRTKDVRAFLEKDYPPESLPSVEEAETLVAKHRALIESSLSEESYASQLDALRHQQRERRAPLEEAIRTLEHAHRHQRAAQLVEQGNQRDRLRATHIQATQAVKRQRYESRPTGLAAFLGRVSGVTLVRRVWHRHQDARRVETYRAEREQVKTAQARERDALDRRLAIEIKDVQRQLVAMRRVDRRELAAFLRDQRTELRIRDRDGGRNMPPLPDKLLRPHAAPASPLDVLAAYEKAKARQPRPPQDLERDFGRAAEGRGQSPGGDDAATRAPSVETPHDPEVKRER